MMATFSGGNQQKALLGRWLMRSAKVLLLAEPTRGVDVAARASIHRTLLELRDAGVAILFASSDLDEVVTISDRVLVFSRGRMIEEDPGGGSRREEYPPSGCDMTRTEGPQLNGRRVVRNVFDLLGGFQTLLLVFAVVVAFLVLRRRERAVPVVVRPS